MPLNALRAFEAAGRHGSFLRAAEELSVTPGAIAQQIKKLEDWVGGPLFQRHAQGVSLTDLGMRALPHMTSAFDSLGLAAQELRREVGTATIRIAALPAIAQLWLSPRLSDLHRMLPDVDLSIHALDICPPLNRGAFDLSVYPSDLALQPQGQTRVLAQNALLPVAAPDLAKTISRPEDLQSASLLHDLAWRDDWETWLKAQMIDGVETARGPTHSLYSIAIERCIEGDGVLIGHSALIERPLRQGQLVAVFDNRSVPAAPICLAAPDATGGRLGEVIDAFCAAA